MNKVFTLVKVSTKVGLSGLALYTTHDLGVWGDAKKGEQLYYKLKEAKLKDLLPEEVGSQIPDLGIPEELSSAASAVSDVKKNIWSHYNSAVSGICGGLAGLPEVASGCANEAIEFVKENMK